MKRFIPVLMSAVVASACATTQARTPVERPALEVPPVPPRVIDSPVLPPPPPEPVPELPSAPAAPKSRPQSPREPAKAEPPKTETTPPVAPAVPPATPPSTPAVPPLRTSTTPDVAATRQVREVLDRALGALSSVDYRILNAQGRAQYENAKLFLTQAEESLKAANYEYARNLADKAERIAKELTGK